MGDRETALIICPEAPYPLAGGGALRTASLVEYLARKYEDIARRPTSGEFLKAYRHAEAIGHVGLD